MNGWEEEFKELTDSDYSVGIFGMELEEARDFLLREFKSDISQKEIKLTYEELEAEQKNDREQKI